MKKYERENREELIMDILSEVEGNAIVVLSSENDKEYDEDLFVFIARDYNVSDYNLERIMEYPFALLPKVYPLNGTRYTIRRGIMNDASRSRFIQVIAENDICWVC